MKPILYIFVITYLFSSCAPTRYVEVLDKGDVTIGANFGGPLIQFGEAVIPVPLTAIYAGYGIDSSITIHGGIHTTSLLYNNLQMDLGATFKLLNQNKFVPSVSATPGVQFAFDLDSPVKKLWPSIAANAYWNYGVRRNYFYVGIDNWVVLNKYRSQQQPSEARWVFIPQIGHVIKSKNENWQTAIELKWMAPNHSHAYSFVPYANVFGQQGAAGVFISVSKKIK